MLLLANLLLALSAVPTLLLAFASKGTGPEGPVGAHMITAPLALLQIAALAIGFHGGDWDFVPIPGLLFYAVMLGYLVAMTALPIMAMAGNDRVRSRWGVAAVLAGCVTAVDGAAFAEVTRVPHLVGGGLVALASLGGWLVLGALFVHSQRNAMRVAAADAERMSDFEKNQAAYDLGEFGKLPAKAELWQLIQFTHSFHPDVKRQCHERIAALPDLQHQMLELLGTGWAKHALAYLDDFYPLPHHPLAPAFARFLDAEFEEWQPKLAHDGNPGSWSANLSRHFEVADKVVQGGGELRPQLQRWHEFLARTRGLGGLAARVQQIRAQPR